MVETSSYTVRLYPDFEPPANPRQGVAYANANAPPMTTAESERWPLTSVSPPMYTQADPRNAYYIPPFYGEPPHEHPCRRHSIHRHHCDRRGGCQGQGFICSTLRVGLFHVLNALLGVFAFVAVITGVHVAIGLIPLCCVGLLVFRGIVVLVQWLAMLDVTLSNYVASPSEERVIVSDSDHPLGRFDGLRLSSELAHFSPMSLLGALYFSTVKFVMSMMSLVVVSVFSSLPMLLIAYNDDDNDWLIKVHHHKTVNLRQYPLTFYVLWGCLCILTIIAMHVVAWLSRALTHFFCCDRVSPSEYTIPIVQYPDTATTTMYGFNIGN